MSPAKQKAIDETNIYLRLRRTPIQNKFLLLYSVIYESNLEKRELLKAGIEEELAIDKHNKLMRDLNFKKQELFRSLEFETADECRRVLETTSRFKLEDNGNIDIK